MKYKFTQETPVIVVGNGAFVAKDLNHFPSNWPIYAADGGANHLVDIGRTPKAIIGDLDSIDPQVLSTQARLCHQLHDQETTDFEKCLSQVQHQRR